MSEAKRILIWDKTYPELSNRYQETVCTGACLEDGRPIRIYPVPLRYLSEHNQYKLYDWVEVPLIRSTSDARPESYKVNGEHLNVAGHIDPGSGWTTRRNVIFADRSWHYECLEDLKAAEAANRTSLGLVTVGSVEWVKLKERPAEDRAKHEAELARLKSKLDLFAPDQKNLQFQPFWVHVRWFCARMDGPNACPGHTAGVLDWGLGELGRKKGADAALSKMRELTDISRYDLRFCVGNFKAHPKNFGIVGLWYPKRGVQGDLFAAL